MRTSPASSAPRRSPQALPTLARLWVSGATGVIRSASCPRGIPMCRGGVVSADDLPALARIAREDWIQFDHYSVVGEPNRAAVARVITGTAAEYLPRPPPPGVAHVVALAPKKRLDEIGLVAVRRDGERLVVPSSPLVAALELLRLIRVESWGAAPMLPDGVPLHDATVAGRGGHDPLHHRSAYDDVLFAADIVNIEDLAEAAEIQRPPPVVNPLLALREVRDLLDIGEIDTARELLVAMTETRLDQPEALYLLVEATARQLEDSASLPISDLRNWMVLADSLGGAGQARARAEAVLRGLSVMPSKSLAPGRPT